MDPACQDGAQSDMQGETSDLPSLPSGLQIYYPQEFLEEFWWSYDSWFRTHGITLYNLDNPWSSDAYRLWFPPDDRPQVPVLPFACRLDYSGEYPGIRPRPRFAYGQDPSGRDVFIKIIEKGSVEHSINSHLLKNSELFLGERFPFVLPPVAILDSPHDFSFLVMPLWGSPCQIASLPTVRHVMKFLSCVLTGLEFLHEHRIAHRDINDINMLVNCYCTYSNPNSSEVAGILRGHIQTSKDVAYALFDFNLSAQFPEDADIRTARLTSCEAFNGAPMWHPPDVYRGEPEYNPFAFDVACLGNLLLFNFARVIPAVPPLAPLLARMTTHVVRQRFTASEARAFFQEHLECLSEEELNASAVIEPSFDPLDHPDLFWQQLGPEDRARWSHYRVPPQPWSHRALIWFAMLPPYGWRILYYVRRALHV